MAATKTKRPKKSTKTKSAAKTKTAAKKAASNKKTSKAKSNSKAKSTKAKSTTKKTGRPKAEPVELTKTQQAALDRINKKVETANAAEDAIGDAVAKARAQDLTWRQIADSMGVSLSTVYNRYAPPTDNGEDS